MCHRPLSCRIGLILCFFAPAASSQVAYELSVDPPSKRWTVDVSFDNPVAQGPGPVAQGPGDEELLFHFARWTAGAYHLADFGRFVEELEALDGTGAALEVERKDDSTFRIATNGCAQVHVHYTARSISTAVFTDGTIDVESNRLAKKHAFVNPVSLFGFAAGLVDEEVTLDIDMPAGWRCATALELGEDGLYHAPSFLCFEDSPLLLSPTLQTVHFEVDGKPHAVSTHGKTLAETEQIAAGCERIATATSALLQGLPYSHYHFLFGFTPQGAGAGLEHSFSTLILLPAGTPTMEANEGFWSLVAHEFMHTWCAERIHVQGLHHPDYTQPFETASLWVNEGITEYFTKHILLHAGFMTRERLLASLLPTGDMPSSGRATSWTQISRTAMNWTQGNGIQNWISSMYGTGPKIIFALDLEMRRASDGQRGIIDLLRFMRHAYIDADRGFVEGGMSHLISGIAQADLGSFHRRFIDGLEYPDVPGLLEVIGYGMVDDALEALEDPSTAQLAARADFFSE